MAQLEPVPPQLAGLPARWRLVPFATALRDVTGGRPKLPKGEYLQEGRFPVIDQGQEFIGGWTNDADLVSRFDRPVVLFGDHTKTFKFIGEPFVLGADGVKVLQPTNGVEPSFAYHYARSLDLPDVGYSRHFKFVQRKWFPLPPLDEQRRIAAILDKADAIRRKRREAIALTEELLQSAFVHTVGGRNPAYVDWAPTSIAKLVGKRKGAIRSGPFGSALKHSEFVDEGIAVLGIDNAVQNRFAWSERRFITPEKYEKLRQYQVFPGDVIITIMGTTGRSAVVPDDIPEAITTKHLATISVDRNRALPEYVSHALHRDEYLLHQVAMRNRGAIMAGLNLGIIKELKVHLPPLKTQQKWVQQVSSINEMRARQQTAAETADALFHSLVQRAFRGDL